MAETPCLAATTLASSGRLMSRGTINAARMPRMASTTKSSMREKPPTERCPRIKRWDEPGSSGGQNWR